LITIRNGICFEYVKRLRTCVECGQHKGSKRTRNCNYNCISCCMGSFWSKQVPVTMRTYSINSAY